jgi:hypothetical protein
MRWALIVAMVAACGDTSMKTDAQVPVDMDADADSDGDCIPDVVEGARSPRDTDGDGVDDVMDRDSDGDGLADGAEDTNCDGVVDPTESSATDADSDDDGADDLDEVGVGSDPLDPLDNPASRNEVVVRVPYQVAPSTTPIVFDARLRSIDAYVLVDRSGTMAVELAAVEAGLASAIDGIRCPPHGTGDPSTCISDLWTGVGTLGYQLNAPYTHLVDLSPTLAVPSLSALSGTPSEEASLFALWATVTGGGSGPSGCSLSSTPSRSSCASSPAGVNGWGYPCFRPTALPIVFLLTDEPPIDPDSDVYTCPTWPSVRAPFNGRSASIIGITGAPPHSETLIPDLERMATDTGALDANDNDEPIVLDGGKDMQVGAIVSGLQKLRSGLRLDLSASGTDDTSDAVDAIDVFVERLETVQVPSGDCTIGLADRDSNADGFADEYVLANVGVPVCWSVVTKQNTTIPATAAPQTFRATIDIAARQMRTDSRTVVFLVPPL